jgi:GH24 family phage-related lysozyme (muramidase)
MLTHPRAIPPLSPHFDANDENKIISHFKRHEGAVGYLYRDSFGYPTVGVGHLVPDVDAALALPFQYGNDPAIIRPATPDDIRAGYNALPPQTTPPMPHTAYHPARRGLAPLYLLPHDQDDLLQADIRAHARLVVQKFDGFQTLPAPVRLGLLDMQFNMGGRFNRRTWPQFFAAINQRDFSAAARECIRPQIGQARNADIQALFLCPDLGGTAYV